MGNTYAVNTRFDYLQRLGCVRGFLSVFQVCPARAYAMYQVRVHSYVLGTFFSFREESFLRSLYPFYCVRVHSFGDALPTRFGLLNPDARMFHLRDPLMQTVCPLLAYRLSTTVGLFKVPKLLRSHCTLYDGLQNPCLRMFCFVFRVQPPKVMLLCGNNYTIVSALTLSWTRGRLILPPISPTSFRVELS